MIKLFIYGTLMPGNSRHHAIERHIIGEPEKATVRGQLFDMGFYPALVINDKGTVHGYVVKVDPDVLKITDYIEGYKEKGHPANLYERVTTMANGELVTTYVWGKGQLKGNVISTGRWEE